MLVHRSRYFEVQASFGLGLGIYVAEDEVVIFIACFAILIKRSLFSDMRRKKAAKQ